METVKKILIIDDDGIANFVTEKLLLKCDSRYEISTYTNSMRALSDLVDEDEASHELPDLIFLDINMPELDGFDFLTKLQDYEISDKVAVIVYTSSSNPKDVDKSKKYENVIGYMQKPFSVNTYTKILELSNIHPN
jgi:CheY-like chemotaxis protein